jgi:glucose/arabinose dehydrogenase
VPLVLLALLAGTIPAALEVAGAPPASAFPGATMPEAAPGLVVSTAMSGLSNAWDTAFAPDGAMFVTERAGAIRVRRPNGATATLTADLADLWVSGETGLMGIEVDPAFGANRRLYTCQGTTDDAGGTVDGSSVQVVAWTVDAGYTALTRVADPLVGGIPGTSGRHGGCQLRVDPQGFLRVGTGDAGTGTNPQDVNVLAGKTLRVDRFSGAGAPGNPFAGGGGDPRIFTYGHRNVQGLAVHPTTGEVWSAEHGPGIDDEVNRLVAGGNYGWNPVPGYNENVPMTDLAEFPSARSAQWSSGNPTIATSGATFLRGPQWGPWQGALAVATLGGQSLRIMRFGADGTLVDEAIPAALNGTQGRLRSAETGPCGDLYLTTDVGGGSSRVLVVRAEVDAGGPGAVSVSGSLVASRCGPVQGDVQLNTFDGSAWGAWTSFGGSTLAEPDLSSWGPGRLDVFVLGLDGAVWHRGRQGATAFPWESLGGRFTSAPSAVSWTNGRIDVFGRGLDGAIWTNYWTGTGWAGWYSLGGVLTSGPDSASVGPDRWDVFARGLDGAMYTRSWTGAGFTPWISLGGGFTSGPGAVAITGNRVDVTARGLDGAVWTAFRSGPTWSGWSTVGGFARSAPDLASRGPGTWDVLVEGGDRRLYARSWTGFTYTAYTALPA